MEVALDDTVPTFSGGLGVLAGDHLRAAADRGLRIAGVTLLYAHGFFRQRLVDGEQTEAPVEWSPSAHLDALDEQVTVVVSGRRVRVRAWRAMLHGAGGHEVPVYFLDTALEENAPEDRAITDHLYASDPHERLRQEAVLGFGGPLLLEALGHGTIRVHHLNEGHGALVPVGLLARRRGAADTSAYGSALEGASGVDLDAVRTSCVFTTHTPVPAGHDRFDPGVAAQVLGSSLVGSLGALGCLEADGTLNMTVLGMRTACSVNGVSAMHRRVTEAMFPGHTVMSITNGVHAATWAAPATAAMFDRYLPGWRLDSQQLRYAAIELPLDALAGAHAENKQALCAAVHARTGVDVRTDALVVGIARRFAAYKRNDLVLSDLERLTTIAEAGPVQIVFAGKAHPGDSHAKDMIRHVAALTGDHRNGVRVAFVEDYGMALGRLLCAGSDVWLNTPIPPNEASGTSGMKAALNGVPSLSTLDGWWAEGGIDGLTGWTIVDAAGPDAANRLYDALEEVVVPTYYKDREALVAMGRQAIALNGSFFSADRMVDEYCRRAYGSWLDAR
jgi:starch phosphorylase